MRLHVVDTPLAKSVPIIRDAVTGTATGPKRTGRRPLVAPRVLSAKSASALPEQAARLQRSVEQPTDADANDVAYWLVATGGSFDYRAVAVGAGRHELLRGLGAIASDAPAPNVAIGKAAASGGTVFVFPGQGSQWAGMAVELLDSAPTFAEQMRLCDAAFAEFVNWSLLEAVRGGVASPSLDRVDVVQPVLFAVMVSLAAQWRALGIHPDAVLGHSHGEIAAAYVAGALSLRDAAKVVTLRSKAISAIAGTGGMVSIPRPLQRVCALIEPWGQSISVAAQNGPSSTVVTGNAAALDELMAEYERDDVAGQADSCRLRLAFSPCGGAAGDTARVTFWAAAANRRYRIHLHAHRRRAGYVDPRRRLLVRQSAPTGAIRTGCPMGVRTWLSHVH